MGSCGGWRNSAAGRWRTGARACFRPVVDVVSICRMGDTTIAPPLMEVVSPVRSGVGCLSEILDYIERLRRQVPEVERLRDQGRARGDLTAVRNAEHLLAQWAVLISTNTPANDLGPSHQQRLPAQMLPARDIA